MSWDAGTIVSVMFTLAVLTSVFFKKSIAFEIAQPIFLGVAAGHGVVVNIGIIHSSGWKAFLAGETGTIIPLILGILVLSRISSKWAWISRISIAIIVATGAALGLRGALKAQILDQVSATFVSLNSLENIVLFVGTCCTLIYFFFSSKYAKLFAGHGPLRYVPEAGKVVMMIAFGASFGNAAMGRLSLLIGRMLFLLKDWLHLAS